MSCKRFLIIFLTVLSQVSFSQYDPDYEDGEEEDLEILSFKDRLYTGGVFWANFGTFTNVEISPLLGYRVTNNYSVGVGAKYNYYKQNLTPVYSTSIYGGSLFTRYTFLTKFVAHGEIEMLNLELFHSFSNRERTWVPIGLVGGGYSSGGIQFLLLYDLIGNKNNPYQGFLGQDSRIYLRVGFLFNL